jgi:hypothetical protein
VEALMGIACSTEAVRHEIEEAMSSTAVGLRAVTRADWYFE